VEVDPLTVDSLVQRPVSEIPECSLVCSQAGHGSRPRSAGHCVLVEHYSPADSRPRLQVAAATATRSQAGHLSRPRSADHCVLVERYSPADSHPRLQVAGSTAARWRAGSAVDLNLLSPVYLEALA